MSISTEMAATMELSKIVKVIEDLEARLTSLRKLVDPDGTHTPPEKRKRRQKKEKDPNAPKREPNAWIKFTQRVRTVLKENGEEIKMAKHFMKFAKEVQPAEGEEISDAVILERRRGWEPPAAGSESEAEVAEATDASAPVEEKKRGRKPMTDEQKAEAKAKREAAAAAEGATASESEAASGGVAKKKIVAKKTK